MLQRISKTLGQRYKNVALLRTHIDIIGNSVSSLPAGSHDKFGRNADIEKRSFCNFCRKDLLLELGQVKRIGRSQKILALDKRLFHSTPSFFMATIVKEVPSMGDSITEGTLIEWSKNIGDAIEVDDVVCIVETDKVSVDIRSENAGVLMEVFAEIDDTVEVGKPLYTIDTEGTATNSSSNSSMNKDDEVETSSKPNVEATVSSPTMNSNLNSFSSSLDAGPSGYIPSIQFRYGQREKKQAIISTNNVIRTIPSISRVPVKHTPGAKDFVDMPTMYGRPVISLEEMDAIDSGGAF